MKHRVTVIFLFLALLTAVVCVAEGDRFELVFLEGIGLGYEYAEAREKLQTAEVTDSLFHLTEDDVAEYAEDEYELRFVLTIVASQRLREGFIKSGDTSQRPLERALEMRPFLVLLDSERLFGGVFLYPISARGIDYPVIHLDESEERVVFHVKPFQGFFTPSAEEMERIVFPELEGFFETLGKTGD